MLATVQDMVLLVVFFFFKTYVFKTQHISAVRRLKHDHTSAQHSLTDLLPAFLSIYSNSQAMLLQVSQSLPCRAGQHQHAQNYSGSHWRHDIQHGWITLSQGLDHADCILALFSSSANSFFMVYINTFKPGEISFCHSWSQMLPAVASTRSCWNVCF